VDFTIVLQKGKVEELEATKYDNGCNGIEKLFKLASTGSTSNMHLFDAEDRLKKYDTVEEIIDDYFVTRLDLYNKRKEHLIEALEQILVVLSNKARYIQELLDGTIDLRKRKRDEIVALLSEKGYNIVDDDGEYKYLTKMPMDSVSEENVAKINREHEDKLDELERIKETTIHCMWLQDLELLEKEYQIYKQERTCKQTGKEGPVKKKMVVKKVSDITKKVVKKTHLLVESEEFEITVSVPIKK
jgi:DNA topoisomerase-2